MEGGATFALRCRYAIKIRAPRNRVGLILPDEPDIKIAAITLEK